MDYFKRILAEISEIIKINSEEDIPEPGAPFGKGPRKALDHFLQLAKNLGFQTRNIDGYAGEVIFGEGEEFAILAHLDVVPAGSGWTHDPYGGEIDYSSRRIWGRGTMDDKGPAVITLFALKALKDEGFMPKRKIKFIVGCNEESGWGCIDYYKKHEHMPEEGISPDANFPVIYAEKGIMQLKLKFGANGDWTSLKGGERPNMVCDYCEAEFGEDRELLKKLGLEYSSGKVISRGKSAHGSTPEAGVNAIPPILKYLGLDSVYGSLFALKAELEKLKDESGNLTFSPDVIKGGKDYIEITCDVRYPATMTRDKVLDIVKASGISFQTLHEQLPLFNDKNSRLITTLCSVYNEITGNNVSPIAIGGGTYARALKFGAAFGPEEDGEENTIHQPNEYITFEKVEKCFKIYKLAIERLTGFNGIKG